ncbi:MAG: helicase-related protein [Nitrososphaerales archaeon]
MIRPPTGYISHPLIYEGVVEDREYQRAISEAARDRNTLVVLPTALGKTVISALVAARVLYGDRDGRVLVMAPTRPLCEQHMATFRGLMRLPEDDFVLLTGRTEASLREVVWSGRSRLVFATPEVVRNDLLAKRMTLGSFGLLVFDECHRSVKEYAYTEIADQYARSSAYPLILGMTASPGSEVERVRNVCESLFIEHVEYRTEEDPDVRPYVQPIAVGTVTVDLPREYEPVREIIKGMLEERVRWLRSRGYLRGPYAGGVSRRQLVELGTELRYSAEMSIEEERGPIYAVISRQASALTAFHMLELLETQGAHTLAAFVERMADGAGSEGGEKKKGRSGLANDAGLAALRGILLDGRGGLVEHPKVGALSALLRDQFETNQGSRVLVFTQYRDTATHLVQELNEVPGVRAERFVGQSSKEHDRGLTQDEQSTIIRDLRKGYLNTLVATSIAEEGLDIPQVDLVVFYEPIPSEIRYIQRRGRTGRRTAGRAVILAARGTSDAIYLQASQDRVERMKEIAQRLNSVLRPVLRVRSRPASAPLTPEELAGIYARTMPRPEGTDASVGQRSRAQDDMRRLVSRAERALYMKILEHGTEGIDNDALYSEVEDEYGYPREVAKAALDRLLKAKRVAAANGARRLAPSPPAPSRSSIPPREIPGASRMTIEVEKVASGQAFVLIDGSSRARLLPQNYAGPRELIKKGMTFVALCSLYEDEGTLCVNVRQVVQAG